MPRAQQLGDRPALRNAAARGERSVSIKNFAYRAEPVSMNVPAEWFENAQSGGAVSINTKMSQREWAEQPSPDGALMVDAIAGMRITTVVSAVTIFAGSEAAQAVRSEEMLRANLHDVFLLAGGKRAKRKGDGKNLIWA